MEQEVAPRKRGFAAMDPEKRQEIARKGGRNVPARKRGFSRPGVAAEAGRKGGRGVDPAKRSFSVNRELAREAGRKGGRGNKRADPVAPEGV